MTVGHGDLHSSGVVVRYFSACCALTCPPLPFHSEQRHLHPSLLGTWCFGHRHPAALEGRFYCSRFGGVLSLVKSNLHDQ